MKFTYGYWMNKPGVENADAVQIREVKVFPDKVYLYAVPYPQDERGMGGPVLEMTISSPKQDILRTQAYHFMGSAKKEPQFELDAEACPLAVTEFEGGLSVTSGTCTTSTSFRPLSRCSSIPSAQSERPSDRRHRPAHDAGSFRRSNGCTGCSYGTYQSTSLMICHPHRRAQSTFCPIFYLRFRKKYDIVIPCAETAHRSASDFLSDSAGTGILPHDCAADPAKKGVLLCLRSC